MPTVTDSEPVFMDPHELLAMQDAETSVYPNLSTDMTLLNVSDLSACGSVTSAISKASYVQPQQPRVYCTQCDEHKEGFHKKNDLYQHIVARHPRAHEILYLRHVLQKGLLNRESELREEEMKPMSEMLARLETYTDLEASIIKITKINKVLKLILKLPDIPKEAELQFKSRSQTLLDKWNKNLTSDVAPPAAPASPANGVNGTSNEAVTLKESKEHANGVGGDAAAPKLATNEDAKETLKAESEPKGVAPVLDQSSISSTPHPSSYPIQSYRYDIEESGLRPTQYSKVEDGATDSGYASLPNLGRVSNRRIGEDYYAREGSDSRPPSDQAPNSEAGTIFSAATTIMPEVVQDSISYICEDIYNNIQHVVNLPGCKSIVGSLHELIKAFALTLGADTSNSFNQRAMHFVYKHHNEIGAILNAKFDSEDEGGFLSEKTDGMTVLDKMAMWEKEDCPEQQIEAAYDHDDDLFEGVDDLDNDEPIAPPEVAVYKKLILESTAYKWLLGMLQSKLTLHWGEGQSNVTGNDIRHKILQKLPTGKISRNRPPTTFRVTFKLHWFFPIVESRLAGLLPMLDGSTPSFADILVSIYSSDAEVQTTTIRQYLHQVWPDSGPSLIQGLQTALDGSADDQPISGELTTQPQGYMLTVSSVMTADKTTTEFSFVKSVFRLAVHGPAYSIAQRAEQLAWLETALNPTANHVPHIHEIGHLEFLVRSIQTEQDALPYSSHLTSAGRWWSGLNQASLVHGYPTLRRPAGFDGVELPSGVLLALDLTLDLHGQSRGIILKGLPLTLGLVRNANDVWLWHIIDTRSGVCACHHTQTLQGDLRSVAGLDFRRVAAGRHIIGYCEGTGSQRHNESQTPCRAQQKAETSNTKVLAPVADELIPSFDTQISASDSFDSDMLSISSFSEDMVLSCLNDDDDNLSTVVNAVIYQLFSKIGIGKFLMQRTAACDGESGSNTNATPVTAPYSSGCGHGSSTLGSPSPRKRKANQQDRDESDEDDSDYGRPKKRAQREQVQHKLFACPFWKLDPAKHRACFRLKLCTSSRVKQHLSRKHTPRFYCQICYVIFQDRGTQDEHVMQRSCTRNPGTRLNGIRPDQQEMLSKKPKTVISEEDKWFGIWDIILPEDRRPTSPYIDSRLADCCALFREHWQNEGAEILTQQIQASGIFSSAEGADQETRNQALPRILARGLDLIWETWNPPGGSQQDEIAPAMISSPVFTSHPNPSLSDPVNRATPASSLVDSGIGSGMYHSSSSSVGNYAYADSVVTSRSGAYPYLGNAYEPLPAHSVDELSQNNLPDLAHICLPPFDASATFGFKSPTTDQSQFDGYISSFPDASQDEFHDVLGTQLP